MAVYLRNSVLVSSLMFFVMIGSLYAQVADKKAICDKAKTPSFCSNYMKFNPKTLGADLKTLAQITFGSAQTSASGASNRIQSLVKTATNPTLNIKVSAAMEGPTTSQGYLANVKSDPFVVKNSDDFQNICGIVLVISNMM